MSIDISIENEYGERLALWHKDGTIGGQALGTFVSALLAYCPERKDEEEDVKKWFNQLEIHLGQAICQLASPFINGSYSGHWDYQEHEYDRFLSDSRDLPLTEEEFKQTLREIDHIWVNGKEMKKATDILVNIFRSKTLGSAWWYDPKESLADFEALKEAVDFLTARVECKVRILLT